MELASVQTKNEDLNQKNNDLIELNKKLIYDIEIKQNILNEETENKLKLEK